MQRRRLDAADNFDEDIEANVIYEIYIVCIYIHTQAHIDRITVEADDWLYAINVRWNKFPDKSIKNVHFTGASGDGYTKAKKNNNKNNTHDNKRKALHLPNSRPQAIESIARNSTKVKAIKNVEKINKKKPRKALEMTIERPMRMQEHAYTLLETSSIKTSSA